MSEHPVDPVWKLVVGSVRPLAPIDMAQRLNARFRGWYVGGSLIGSGWQDLQIEVRMRIRRESFTW